MDTKIKRLIVDVSSIVKTAQHEGKDKEHGKDYDVLDGERVKQQWVNGWQHTYEIAMNMLAAAWRITGTVPMNTILVIEGNHSKTLRQGIYPEYNSKRSPQPPEMREQFVLARDAFVAAVKNAGGSMCWQDGVEADDVIAYLAQNLQGERYVMSRDGDMLALIGGDVHVLRKGELDVNKYGPFDPKYITTYKALLGDTSDGYPGAKGFGEKAFLDMLAGWGDEGLEAMTVLIKRKMLKDLDEDVPQLKSLQKIIDNEAMVYKCYELARFHTEKVNTLRRPLNWSDGLCQSKLVIDERIKPFAGGVRLVHAGNYEQAVKWATPLIQKSPFVTLDIETSTPQESSDWMASRGKDDGVDVFGSELTGLALTFGENLQYTLYFTVDHVETDAIKNVTSEMVRNVVELIPSDTIHTVIQNFSFEGPILLAAWGEAWEDNGWGGQIPNAIDSKIALSYVDENQRTGLKEASKRLLGYTQQTYDEVTTLTGMEGQLPKGGKLLATSVNEGGEEVFTVKYKMNELTAEHVLSYGADDTICTAAVMNHCRIIMELENTWDVYLEVEQLPQYLTNQAYHNGVDFDLERMKQLQAEDQEAYDRNWVLLRDYLIEKGWEGTVCPVYQELTPTNIKEAFLICTGEELKTQVRTVAKFPPLIRDAAPDNAYAALIAKAVEGGDLERMNALVKEQFSGEPVLDINSPNKMKHFLYDVIGIPVRIVNKLTPNERADNQPLRDAMYHFNKVRQGSTSGGPMRPEELELLKGKASTDDTAVASALVFDRETLTAQQVELLGAFQAMKTADTRRKMFYQPYARIQHWKDNKIHPGTNQSAAVTRRYTASDPNTTQLPKKGEGVKFRECYTAHSPDAVIVSIDFAGQELRQMAGQSQDQAMLDCFIGDNKKDIHSITASGAMVSKWGVSRVTELASAMNKSYGTAEEQYDLFIALHKSQNETVAKDADDLRKTGKNVNFAAQFDAMAPKLAEMLIIPLEEAQLFLDAKYARFPRVETWKEEVRDEVLVTGYATTLMGARRHLGASVLSDDKWVSEKAGRQGPNFKIQGSAAEQTKLAIGGLWLEGVYDRYDARFMFPVHDELVSSVNRHDVIDFLREKHAIMTRDYATLGVPAVGSISIGRNFGEQIECGEEFDEARIQAALDKIFGAVKQKEAA